MGRKIKFFPIIIFVLLLVLTASRWAFQQSSQKNNSTIDNCLNQRDQSEKYNCWNNLLQSTLQQKGISQAFLVFEDLYNREPNFAGGCHGYAHTLGADAYKLYAEGKDFNWPPQTAYCGYGFYHGLTEPLLIAKGPKEAGKLCDSKKSQISPVLYDACYHGIGHGALSQTGRQKDIWGNPEKMASAALAVCKESTNNPIQQSRCASGAFMELSNDYTAGQIPIDEEDPLLICKSQPELGKLDCYDQMYGVLSQVGQGDLKTAAKFIENIPEDTYALDSMIDLASTMTDITQNQDKNIAVCRSLQPRLELPCIRGIVLAFMLKGKPGVEYEKAIYFCDSPNLQPDEKQTCFGLILKNSKERYTDQIFNTVCKKIDPIYRSKSCQTN